MSRRPWTDHIDRLQHRITSCYICKGSPYTLTMAEITSSLQLTMSPETLLGLLCRVGRGLTTLTACNIGSQAAISVRDITRPVRSNVPKVMSRRPWTDHIDRVGDLLPHNKPPSFTERSPTYNSYWHGSRSLHCLIPHCNNISGRLRL
ncbi:hypothetical protein J6590_087778 [Homalodisca vitripennis]|nr:hypothetical protein J6590_087778 [Homalodisca vitripennis]